MGSVVDSDDKMEQLTIKLDHAMDAELLRKYGSDYMRVLVTVNDTRLRSLDQIHKAFALFEDMARWWTSVTKEDMYEYMAMKYGQKYHTDPIHLSSATMSEANALIDMTLVFCFEHGVPFATKTWDSISDDYSFQKQCLLHRVCVIDMKPADFCHVDTVGMGNNRLKIDHSKHYVMSLCRYHHQQQHQKGIDWFINENHIKPIKLTRDELVNLGIMTYKQKTYFEEREEYLKTIGAIQ